MLQLLPCVIAIYLSRHAKSDYAKRFLFWGGTLFLVALVSLTIFATLTENLCTGDPIKGFNSCDPAFLLTLTNLLREPFFVAYLSYLFLGPLLLIFTAVAEIWHRHQNA